VNEVENKTGIPYVEIFTDGGCIPNPGRGAWAVILVYGDKEKILTGYDENTTNNRMELKAAIEGLKALKKRCKVVIYTDSEYLKKGMSEWLKSWVEKGWKTNSGTVKNIDLWNELAELVEKHEVTWEWIKGHSQHPQNERCDKLVKDIIKNKIKLEKDTK